MSFPRALDFSIPGSFPYVSLQTRMPIILTKAIDDVHGRVRELGAAADGIEEQEAKIRVALGAIGLMSRLKYEMQTGKEMTPIDDGFADAAQWNAALVGGRKWWEGPWLYAECYMYRRIRAALLTSDLLATHDPFAAMKKESLVQSSAAVDALAIVVSTQLAALPPSAAFELLVESALWGNKMDLSLKPHLNDEAPQAGGSVDALCDHILANHTAEAWAALQARPRGRVDIILDNAGYELYADLCLAHWLVTSGVAAQVVFHAKEYPWYVSDVTQGDFDWVLEQLNTWGGADCVKTLAQSWRQHVASGVWRVDVHPFWTLPHDFRATKDVAPDLVTHLNAASLVIIKGDLNHRKLLADLEWPFTVPFAEASAGFIDAPFLSLRTLKSNLVAGLTAETVARMENVDDWLVKGEYAVIQGSNFS